MKSKMKNWQFAINLTMLVSLVLVRNYIYMPGFSMPASVDPLMRSFCKGWWCDSSKEPHPEMDKYRETFYTFMNGSISSGYSEMLANFSDNDVVAADCLSGFLYMIGFSGFPQDFKKSIELLQKGYEKGHWLCAEILAFHPNITDRDQYIKIAADNGSVLAKQAIIRSELKKPNPNYKDLVPYLYNLAHLGVTSWLRKHRAGRTFGELVKQVSMNPKAKNSWKSLSKLAHNGHHSAAVWLAEGVLSKRTDIIPLEAVGKMLVPYVFQGPWRLDMFDIVSAPNSFNKSTLFQFFTNAGDDLAAALYSYPAMYPPLQP